MGTGQAGALQAHRVPELGVVGRCLDKGGGVDRVPILPSRLGESGGGIKERLERRLEGGSLIVRPRPPPRGKDGARSA